MVDSGAEVLPRPWKTTSSPELLEASDGAGEGLRIAIRAIAVVLSGGERDEDVDGAIDSSSDSEPDSAFTCSRSLIVPSNSPALTNCTGMSRNFLPDSKAFLRWPRTKRASSASENLGFTAGKTSAACLHGEDRRRRNPPSSSGQPEVILPGVARRGVPFLGVFFGVFFAEAFPGLFFPFFFPMMVVYCRRVCRWRVGVKTERLRGECSGTLLVEPQLTMMMTFPVAAGTRGLSARMIAFGGARAQAVRCGSASIASAMYQH